jgi:hypothetical protein
MLPGGHRVAVGVRQRHDGHTQRCAEVVVVKVHVTAAVERRRLKSNAKLECRAAHLSFKRWRPVLSAGACTCSPVKLNVRTFCDSLGGVTVSATKAAQVELKSGRSVSTPISTRVTLDHPAVVSQGTYDLEVVALRGGEHGRDGVRVDVVHVSVGRALQQHPHDRGVPEEGRCYERRLKGVGAGLLEISPTVGVYTGPLCCST